MVQTKKGSGFRYRYLHIAPLLFCYDAFVRQYHDVNLFCMLLSLTFQKLQWYWVLQFTLCFVWAWTTVWLYYLTVYYFVVLFILLSRCLINWAICLTCYLVVCVEIVSAMKTSTQSFTSRTCQCLNPLQRVSLNY